MNEQGNEFYSNCLFEAVKHKFKNWSKVKITYVSPRYNEVFCPHFLWSDGEHDYDFGIERELKWFEIFWFKGYIRQRKLGWNNRWKEYVIRRKKNIGKTGEDENVKPPKGE